MSVARPQAKGDRRLAPLLGLLAVLGCAPTPPAASPGASWSGPIILITLEGLRPDAVGGLGGSAGLTPNLDHLIAEASWAGRAVAASSWLIPSAAALLTGLKPWQHQTITASSKELRHELITLAEALKARGYRTRAYHDSNSLTSESGFGQGFDALRALRRGQRAVEDLRNLKPQQEFIWIHLLQPAPPFSRREAGDLTFADAPPNLPRRIGPLPLETHFDPSVPLPAETRAVFWAMYRYNVVQADALLGRLFKALESKGRAADALLAVTSLDAFELGEHGQVGQGGNLGRTEIEVPLILKLPAALGRRIEPAPSEHVALSRLWATLVEAAGGEAPPSVAPSLFRPGARGILSELYLDAGTNEFSYLEGDLQLRWRQPFAATPKTYYRSRLAAVISPRGSPERAQFRQLIAGLEEEFRAVPPLSGSGLPRTLLLERWGKAGGTERLEDPGLAARQAARLRREFLLFVGDERSVSAERRRAGLDGGGR